MCTRYLAAMNLKYRSVLLNNVKYRYTYLLAAEQLHAMTGGSSLLIWLSDLGNFFM